MSLLSQPSDEALKEMKLTGVSVGYDGKMVVENASFQLLEGQIGCLLGPSGCGKSTLLRAIAGFETLMSGEIQMDDKVISTPSHSLSPEHRKIGMVFQDIALFPHLTIAQNIAFGLSAWPKESAEERVTYLLELVGLSGFQDRYPHSLSGGQQQRVALARAIAPKPKFLLMDEPFSGLDAKLREELVPDIRKILQHEKMSALLVTHDQMEAFAMADQVFVMDAGVIHQTGSPYQIYHEPKTRFVASFIGHGDFLSSIVCGPDCVQSDLGNIRGDLEHGVANNTEVDLLIRPDDVVYDEDSEFVGEIVNKWFRGAHFLYHVKLSSGKIVHCVAASHHDHSIGQKIGLSVHLDHLVLFPC